MALKLLPGEHVIHRSKANVVIRPSDYGLTDLALLGQAGKESIGGHLHITSVRLAFAAHPFNRLRGVLSVPMPLITGTERWRSGLAIGVEVTTTAAVLRFVSWSRQGSLASLAQARADFGPSEQQILDLNNDSTSDVTVRHGAEALNQIAAVLFKWSST